MNSRSIGRLQPKFKPPIKAGLAMNMGDWNSSGGCGEEEDSPCERPEGDTGQGTESYG